MAKDNLIVRNGVGIIDSVVSKEAEELNNELKKKGIRGIEVWLDSRSEDNENVTRFDSKYFSHQLVKDGKDIIVPKQRKEK